MSEPTNYMLVEGWTSPILISLLAQGLQPAGTMDGMTCALVMKATSGIRSTITGTVVVANAANWQVTYLPAPDDLKTGQYYARIRVTDALGRVAYFPSEGADTWTVQPM